MTTPAMRWALACLLATVFAAGCGVKPGKEVLSFSRDDYLKSRVTPMKFAPESGLYKLYVERGEKDAKTYEVIAEVQLMEGGRFGFRDKAGTIVAFAQVSERTDDGAVLRQDREFALPEEQTAQRVFWKYEGK